MSACFFAQQFANVATVASIMIDKYFYYPISYDGIIDLSIDSIPLF